MTGDLSSFVHRVPDEPRWIDVRGLLLSGHARVAEDGDGFVVLSERLRLGAAVGRPGRRALARLPELEAVAGDEPVEVLVQPEDRPAVEPVLRGWRHDPATLHRLVGRPAQVEASPVEAFPVGVAPGAVLRLVDPAERDVFDGAGLEPALRRDLALALDRGAPVASAFVRGRPVSFCSAAVETESLWDVSIETLPSHRRQGLAAAAFTTLWSHYRSRGKAPVWGAHDSNPASLRLAERLGFLPTARLDVYVAPEPLVPGSLHLDSAPGPDAPGGAP